MNREEVIEYLRTYGEIEANSIENNDVVNELLRLGSQKKFGSGATCKQPDERKPDDVVGKTKNGTLFLTFRKYTPFQSKPKEHKEKEVKLEKNKGKVKK